MKLVIAVVQDKDSTKLLDRLVKAKIRATKLASSGGFLRAGNTTFLIGIPEEQVDEVLEIIGQSCRAREQLVTPMSPVGTQMENYISYPVSVQVGGATVFVVDVDKFAQF
ncbi:MAG: hypothetical protein JWN30_2760 [Bacilli bacterium]|nr:hypothetical protein [Bacilli bacterium]